MKSLLSHSLYMIISSAALLMILPVFLDGPPDSFTGQDAFDNEEALWRNLSECTTGIATGSAAPDGRPLLWKSRDVNDQNQEFHYVDDNGVIPFISVTYEGYTNDYYGGVNAAGFALENSDAHNMVHDVCGRNGWGSGADDGKIHKLALSTCRTVDEFAGLLDSLNEGGRTLNCNYGAIDAFGGAAMFEASAHQYTRFDAVDCPDGVIVRANFAYSGIGGRIDSYGLHRHDRALELWNSAAKDHALTPQYIFRNVVRDISSIRLDPYPLPFDGYFENCRYGCLPHEYSICRNRSQSVIVVQGVLPGTRPDDAILWAMCGNPVGAVVTPLWVRAGSVPVEYRSDSGSRISAISVAIREWVWSPGSPNMTLDTWRLTNPLRRGIWDYTLPLEDWIFRKTTRFLNSNEFSYDRLEGFQNTIAAQVADSLESWKPSHFNSNELVIEAWAERRGAVVMLSWDDEELGLAGNNDPSGYIVYRSDLPFREGVAGDSLAWVNNPNIFVDHSPPLTGAFYRVEAVYQ